MSIKISCVCPTHGRAHIIGEAIESYLRQEPCGFETELVIVNDCEEQPLVCDAPNVRVINAPPCRSSCEKFDLSVANALGEYVAWWEDDDISLPWRLRRSVEATNGLQDNYKQSNAWHMLDGVIMGQGPNFFFGNSIWRKSDYRGASGSGVGVEGYPDHNAHMGIVASLHERGGWYTHEEAAPEHIYFIYRRSSAVVPDSGFGADHSDPYARQILFHERAINHPQFAPGVQHVVPKWSSDYTELARRAAQI